MPELVLYGIRLRTKQFLRTVLDMEVDHSVCDRGHLREREYFQDRKSEIGLMSVRDDGTMCVVKVRLSSHHHHNHHLCR